MIKEVILVGIGGFAGSALRYLVSSAIIGTGLNSALPLGTFTVNTAGSLLIGVVLALTSSVGASGLYFLCAVGFCGGFTTFSTFSAEALALLRAGNFTIASLYIALSVVTCVGATWLGMIIGERLKL